MAWIETIEPDEARGPLKEEYDRAVARAGKIYNIVKLSSLRPGFDDVAILEMAHIAGFFNYINRVADALGVDPEPEWASIK